MSVGFPRVEIRELEAGLVQRMRPEEVGLPAVICCGKRPAVHVAVSSRSGWAIPKRLREHMAAFLTDAASAASNLDRHAGSVLVEMCVQMPERLRESADAVV